MDEIFRQLASHCDNDGFTQASQDDVHRWACDLELNLSDFLDRIGDEIAKRYHAGLYSFEFCDSLINDLWSVLIERVVKHQEVRWPDLFYEVYQAFDAGEYHRRADRRDDPISEFTDPLVAAIVQRMTDRS